MGTEQGRELGRQAKRTLPLILATELLELPGLQWTGRLLLVQQSQAVNALLHHGYLCIWPRQGERRGESAQN